MSGDSSRLVRSLYDAYGRRDQAAIFPLIHPEVEIYQTELLPWGGRFRGLDGFRDFLGRLTQAIDSVVEVDRLIEAGDRVAAVGRTHGRVRANDRAFDVPVVHLWTVRDGRIAGFEAYIDTPAMRQALDAPPAS